MKLFYFLFLFLFSSWLYAAQNTQTIPNVVVTQSPVTGYTQNRRTVLPLQVITSQQITDSGAKNIIQVLQSAGIQASSTPGENNPQISMRGFGDNATENMLLLINGVPLRQPDMSSINLNQIPIQNISHIEIWNGGAGVQYGDQAVGGVINIITKTPMRNFREMQAQIGSYNGKSIVAAVSHRWKNNLGLGLNMQHNQTDNYRYHNQEKNNYLNGNMDYAWQKGKTHWDYFLTQQWLQLPGALTWQQVKQNPRQTQFPNERDFSQSLNQLVQGNITQNLAENWQLSMPLLYNAMNGNGRLSNMDFTQARHEINALPTLKTDFNLWQRPVVNHFNLEADNATYSLNYPGIYATNAQQTQYGAANTLDIALSWRWHFLAGYRYAVIYNKQNGNGENNLDNSNNAHAYDVGLSWQIKPYLRWFLRDNQVFRFPKVDEDVNTNTGKPLKTQIGQSYETGVTWKTSYLIGMISIYQLNLHNEISTVPVIIGAQTGAVNENLSPTQRQGLIINNTWNINQHWAYALMYQYVHAVFNSGEFKGNAIPFVAPQNFATHLIYKINSHWQAYIEGVYTGPKNLADDVEERSPQLAGYTLYNANVSYQFKKLQVALQVQDITNKLYFDYAVAVYNGAQTADYYYPANRRTVWLTAILRV